MHVSMNRIDYDEYEQGTRVSDKLARRFSDPNVSKLSHLVIGAWDYECATSRRWGWRRCSDSPAARRIRSGCRVHTLGQCAGAPFDDGGDRMNS